MGHMLIIVNLLHLYLKILVLLICLNISPAFKFKPNPLRGGGGCSLNSKTSVLNDWLIKEGLDKNDIKILFPGDGPAVALDTIKKGYIVFRGHFILKIAITFFSSSSSSSSSSSFSSFTPLYKEVQCYPFQWG